MDKSTFNVMHLFARPATPPQEQPLQQSSPPHQQLSPAHSYREPPPSSPPKTLDSLFRNINNNQPVSSDTTPPATANMNNPFRNQAPTQPASNSGPGTPVSSVTAASHSSHGSGNNQPPAERQSALLSLLGTTMGPNNGTSVSASSVGSESNQPLIPHHPPSPPIDQRARPMPTGNEAQGKILLEQLMSGNLAGLGEINQGQGAIGYPSTAAPMPYPPQPYGPFLAEAYQSPYGQENPRELPPPGPQAQPQTFQQQQVSQQVQQQQQPPSPSRKSMFEFVSPFDALASSTVKQQPLPQEIRDHGEPWGSAATDPKRKSMENLMDQLTRSSQGQAPPPQQQHGPYSPEPNTPPAEPMQIQQKPAYGQRQQFHPGSPRGSPPRGYGQQVQSQQRTRESPSGSMQSHGGKARSESSPVRSNWKTNQEHRYRAPKAKTYINSPLQSQNIIFDVAQGQESVQASRDFVKSTAIALVKVDPTFLPGTTIGATHWVAYAMTRGRVRVISRSSGDRTLLQLPPVFGPTVSVTDMAVYGNRLAGVTSDGGFVVWELPEVITDDVPGQVLVCIVPHNDFELLHSVKWHPKDPDTLAVASDSNIYLLNVADAADVFHGQSFTQVDLHRVSQIFSVSSPLVSFDFDIPHKALATISEDSVLTLWNIPDKLPFWSHKISGEGIPSSLTFLDGGVVIGRKNGTVLQLLPVMGDVILSTVKFLNNGAEDPEMFGHVAYDSRIQTLWVANSKRDSVIALKVCFEMSTPSPGGEELIRGGYFEQLVEFIGPRPTLNFVILTADADPKGDEANAACIAAKLPPGELALVAFSVHSSGVDQVLIRKEWYESAFLSTTAKFPPFNPTMVPPPPLYEARQQRPVQPARELSQPIPSVPIRLRTPPSEEIDSEQNKEEVRPPEAKGKGQKGKNVGWKDRDESSNGTAGNPKGKEKEKGGDSAVLNESPLGVALSKEIRRVEENLHTRIGRLIAKELDKQQQRLEEARAAEQAADFARQEKILKLISTELTKNTTRVVETAVRGEVQNSVLPSLEGITRAEVKSAINTQISKGVSESIRATMPPEIEKMFIKPQVTDQIARNLANSLTPVIEHHVKDIVAKTLLPAYQAQTSAMHQELAREIHTEIASLKKEVINWQSEAFRSQESMIREMEQAVRSLSEQIKFISMNMPSISHPPPLPSHSSPSSSSSNYLPAGQSPMGQSHHRTAMGSTSNYQPSFQQAPPPSSGLHNQWYGPNLPGPPPAQQVVQQMASQPVAPPQAQKTEEWDDTYLAVLSTQDLKQLRELLARSNPEIIMPSNGPGPLSQAVILTLVHRLAAAIGETSPVDEAFKSSLWWLQRASNTLNTNDPLISPYVGRVLPSVSQMLNTTKQRLGLLPGGPQLVDTTRLISDIQETLNRKPLL